jgi:hypothetical protein
MHELVIANPIPREPVFNDADLVQDVYLESRLLFNLTQRRLL